MSDTELCALRGVGKRYGIRIEQVTPCPSVYLAVAAYRVKTANQEVLIKPFRGTTKRLVRVVNRVRILCDKGYPYMPAWLRANSGQWWVMHNGKPYYVTEWVSGRTLSDDERTYQVLGAALAKLHVASRRSARRRDVTMMKDLLRRDDTFRDQVSRLRSFTSTAAMWLKQERSTCIALADEAWTILENEGGHLALAEESASPPLVHGDVTRPNVIVTAHGIRLIDWEQIRRGSALMEIVKTLANTTDFHQNRMSAVLRGYEGVHPLSDSQRQAVRALFRFPREAWYTARQLDVGQRAAAFPMLTNTWAARQNAIRWLDDWAQR